MLLGACGADEKTLVTDEKTPVIAEGQTLIQVSTDGDFAVNLQTVLITAEPGNTILIPKGTYKLTDGLSLDVEGVTLRGAGEGKTILDFSGQIGSGEGLLVTSANVTLSDFTIRDTAGDGIKSKGADGIIYKDLTVEWTGEPERRTTALTACIPSRLKMF